MSSSQQVNMASMHARCSQTHKRYAYLHGASAQFPIGVSGSAVDTRSLASALRGRFGFRDSQFKFATMLQERAAPIPTPLAPSVSSLALRPHDAGEMRAPPGAANQADLPTSCLSATRPAADSGSGRFSLARLRVRVVAAGIERDPWTQTLI